MQNKSVLVNSMILLVALLIGYGLIYAPLMQQKSILQSRLEDTKQKNEILTNVKQVMTRIKGYEKPLTEEKNETWLINRVSSIANENKIKVLSVEPQRRITIGDYTKISVKFSSVCAYHSLGKFVSALENSTELLKVEKLEIKTSPETGGGSEALREQSIPKVEIVVSTYNITR